MSRDTQTPDQVHHHPHGHHDGPCRCQGRCPGCPRAAAGTLDKAGKTK